MAIIATGNDMMTRLAAGGAFKLDGDQLKTQSKAGHFFQKIGDMFKSLSAAGRLSIANRIMRLEAKMADILRADEPAVPNLAQAPLPDVQANRNAIRAAFLKFAVARSVEKAFPDRAMRQAAGNLVKLALGSNPDVTGGSTKDIRAAVDAKVNLLKAHVDKFPIAFSYSYGEAEFTSSGFETTVRNLTNNGFASESSATDDPTNKTNSFDADNVHDAFAKDAYRSMVTIDGEFIRENALDRAKEMTAGLPRQIARFLTMMGPQSGLAASLSMGLLLEGSAKDHPGAGDMMALNKSGLSVDFKGHVADYHREGDMMHIRLSSNAYLTTLAIDKTLVSQFMGTNRTTGIAGRHYDIEMTIDLSQDMTGKTTPDYTLTGSCTALSDADIAAYNATYHKL